MANRIVDISVSLEAGIKSDPPGMEPKIEYVDHHKNAQFLVDFFPGLKAEDLPDKQGWAIEFTQIHTHAGTHVDAPWHYHTTMDGGKRAIGIDEIPLEWCFQPGVKLDFRHFEDGYLVSSDDIKAELDRIGHALEPLNIVLANTAAGARYGEDDYIHKGCGFGREATLWLCDQGVRMCGTDGWTWDAPFIHTKKRWEETHDPSIIFEGHKAGMVTGYCQIEKLGHLEELPATGFTVACFPVKVKGGSGGWTRAVAIFDD